MRPIVNILTFIIFCLLLFIACEETKNIEEIRMKNTIQLDGWYGDTFKISLKGNFNSLSFEFCDKYNELEIDRCVHIAALFIEEIDFKRIYPIEQEENKFIVDIKDVNELIIKSIHPGKPWVPYSQEITLNNVMFHK